MVCPFAKHGFPCALSELKFERLVTREAPAHAHRAHETRVTSRSNGLQAFTWRQTQAGKANPGSEPGARRSPDSKLLAYCHHDDLPCVVFKGALDSTSREAATGGPHALCRY